MHRLALSFLFVCLAFSVLAAQQTAPSSSSSSSTQGQASQPQQAPAAEEQQPENPNAAVGSELTGTANEAEGKEPHEENAQFKYSKAVVWLGGLVGLGPHASYLLSWTINFLLVVLLFAYLLRSAPKMFRDRTSAIQKGIRDAQAASADAAKRLSDIEARLARIDAEVAEIRASAERESVAEEERIHQAAEEDKRKIIEGAETEIDAIARNARRELKAYAASLAVDLAERNMKVDESTDRALVRQFVGQLGKDGK